MKNKITFPALKFALCGESYSDFFRCPVCRFPVQSPNACSITCQNCGFQGNKQAFSSVERMAT